MPTANGVSGDSKTVSQSQVRLDRQGVSDVTVSVPTALSLSETSLQSELALGYRLPLDVVDLIGLRLPNNMGDAEVTAMRHQLEANRLSNDNAAMKSFATGAKTSGQLAELAQIFKKIEAERQGITHLFRLKQGLQTEIQSLENERSQAESNEERIRLSNRIDLLGKSILQIDETIKDKQAEIDNLEKHKTLLLFALAGSRSQTTSGNESSVVDAEDEAIEFAEFPGLFPKLEKLYYRRLQEDSTTEFIQDKVEERELSNLDKAEERELSNLDKAEERELSNLDDKAFMFAAVFAFTQDGLNSFDSLVASGPEQFAHLPGNSGRRHLSV